MRAIRDLAAEAQELRRSVVDSRRGEVEGFRDELQDLRDALATEPRFEELVAWLGLEGDAVLGAREAIGRGQVEMLGVLTRPREDGCNILREFLPAANLGGRGARLADSG